MPLAPTEHAKRFRLGMPSARHFSASGSGSALVATDDEGPLVEARRILSRRDLKMVKGTKCKSIHLFIY